MPPVEMVWNRIEKDQRLLSHGADFLTHAILDALVDDYMPLIDQMDEEIEWLEDRVLEKPNPETLERILALKHTTLTLRRIVGPQRENMNRLSRDDFDLIASKNKIYYRDIYDHLVRIQDLIESVRDIVSGTLDIYLSATSNRLNEVMKALTVVSTIFLPLSFFAGVYGMNFKYFPEINWPLGYLFVWVLFLSVAGSMIFLFKKRNWF
jgi:magnesium transporter